MGIERVSPNDLTELLTETSAAPQQWAAVLRWANAIPVAAVEGVLGIGVRSVRRLRQCLRAVPWGLGRPVWVDDPSFDLERHMRRSVVADARDERALLAVAADSAVARLPRDRPLWSVTLALDAAGDCHAAIFVLHHVLADGIGGVAAISRLLSGVAPTLPVTPTARPPSRPALARDVLRARAAAVRAVPAGLARGAAGVREILGHRGRDRAGLAPRTSLNRPIGAGRALAVARVPLASVVDVAHANDATVNDVLLAAVGGAIGGVLRARGESIDHIVVSVPVSGRGQGDAALGNEVGVRAVRVPTGSDLRGRLATIKSQKQSADAPTGRSGVPRGSSAAVLGLMFRALARLRLFGVFADRQRFVNTFVTNVRGPTERLFLLGVPVIDVVAISPISGNVTIAAAALSYAGALTVTIIADPDRLPEIDAAAAALQQALDRLLPPPALLPPASEG